MHTLKEFPELHFLPKNYYFQDYNFLNVDILKNGIDS